MKLITCKKCRKATWHNPVGHFLGDDKSGEFKVVFECDNCSTQRVYGSISAAMLPLSERHFIGKELERIHDWSWLPVVGYSTLP